MLIPEVLYRLSQRDVTRQLIQPYSRSEGSTVAAATVNVTHDNNNNGKVLVVTSIVGQFTPEATQTNLNGRIAFQSPAGDVAPMTFYLEGNDVATAAGVAKWVSWQGWYLLLPRWRVFAQGIYSGALANGTQLFVHGVLIPAGTID